MKNIVLILGLLFAMSGQAQVSINAGTSMLVGFSTPGPWNGLHVGVEIPRDDAVSLYGKFTHYFRRMGETYPMGATYTDPVTGQQGYTTIMATTTMDYNVLEGGTRYYLGDGFDYGFGFYGGTHVKLIFNSVKLKLDTEVENPDMMNGTIFSAAFGLGGGAKYSTVRFGTFYLDANLAYIILGQASSDQLDGRMYNSLLFDFNLGWRKQLTWD